MSVKILNEDNFETEVLKTEGTVLVDFYADWCGPCRAMSPIIEDISNEVEETKVGKVNVDESIELATKYNVSSIPTIMVFKNGKLSKTFIGVTEKEEIKNEL